MSSLADIDCTRYLLDVVRQKYNMPHLEDWRNREFTLLATYIQYASGVSISADTLSRLIGKTKNFNYKTSPQAETRRAIAITAGFDSWDQALLSYQSSQSKYQIPVASVHKSQRFRAFSPLVILITAFVILSFVLGYIFYTEVPISPVGNIRIKFLPTPAPNTFIVSYHIQQKAADDSIYIDFGYGKNEILPTPEKKLYLSGNDGKVSHCYAFPDVYHIRLISKQTGAVLDSTTLTVPTKGWEAYKIVRDKFDEPLPVKINGEEVHISENFEIETSYKNDILTELRNFNLNDSIDGDNFHLMASVDVVNGISCYDAEIYTVGETGEISFLFLSKGCHKYAKIQLGEKKYLATDIDLSFLGHQLTSKDTVSIINRDKNVLLLLGKEVLYQAKYTRSLGSVKGLIFRFKGIGKINFVSIQ